MTPSCTNCFYGPKAWASHTMTGKTDKFLGNCTHPERAYLGARLTLGTNTGANCSHHLASPTAIKAYREVNSLRIVQ